MWPNMGYSDLVSLVTGNVLTQLKGTFVILSFRQDSSVCPKNLKVDFANIKIQHNLCNLTSPIIYVS